MSSKVNEKSTKTEIWAAYKELLAEFQAGPIAVVTGDNKVNGLSAALEQSKSDLLAKFDTTLKAVDGAADDYVVAEQTLARRKAEIISDLEKSRLELQTSIDQVRKDWEQEQTDRKRSRERETEEYAYDIGKKRRTEEETFEAKWQAKFADLNTREAALKVQEGRLAELEQGAEKAPELLQKAVKEACDLLAKELKATHEAELKEVRQQLEHQKSMLELKLQTAEAAATAKDKQLTDLQKQLDNASAQLKDMAVTVIRASSQQGQSGDSTAGS
jgi:chromosome segregation ATPase